MAVAVNQIPGLTFEPADDDRSAEIEDVRVGVGDAIALPANTENPLRRTSLRSRTAPLVTNPTHPSARKMLALTSPTNAPRPGRIIKILEDHNTRGGDAENVIPPVGARVVIMAPFHRRSRGANPRCCSIPCQGREFFKQALNAGVRETLVWQAHLEIFDGARNEARAEAVELLKTSNHRSIRFHIGSPA